MTAIAKFCDDFRRGPRVRSKSCLPRIEVAMDDARRRAISGDWDRAKGATFVGLYALCHRMVYKVVPEELYHERAMSTACRLAAQLAHKHFEDEREEVAKFVRWAWEREKRKAEWARGKFDRNRMSYRTQFSLGLLTDYRVACSQKRR